MSDECEQADELLALKSIYGDGCRINDANVHTGKLVFDLNYDLGHPTVLCDGAVIPLKYLSPVTLQFSLPSNYPSSSPPDFVISCLWLAPQQIEVLAKELDEIWKSNYNSVVLFTWANFLQTEALRKLNLNFPFHLSGEKLLKLTEYNISRGEREFMTGAFECPICLCMKLGTGCLKLMDCGHVFCKECFTNLLTVHISDGDVVSLTCPAAKCSIEIHPSIIKSLVSSSDFERYDRLLLQNTLNSMADIVYCPRKQCASPVIVDKQEEMGMCQVCQYAFCIHCKKAYHGVEECQMKSEELNNLKIAYTEGNSETKRRLERIYGQKHIKELLDNFATQEWVETNSKKCPRCSTNIEKVEGCNKMSCTKCKTSFCWLCNQELQGPNPYKHFATPLSRCYNKLFEGADIDDDDDDDGRFNDLFRMDV